MEEGEEEGKGEQEESKEDDSKDETKSEETETAAQSHAKEAEEEEEEKEEGDAATTQVRDDDITQTFKSMGRSVESEVHDPGDAVIFELHDSDAPHLQDGGTPRSSRLSCQHTHMHSPALVSHSHVGGRSEQKPVEARFHVVSYSHFGGRSKKKSV